ncbi:MAG: hypothetical protein COW30_03680 [Rhodospirillales bacterium CG15_BIG_FIL_POST_REV_8_21_14_020_66_15]|nr:MAG: hypothetical protein COW30_03680 [Rhodospirillales bacterium CG15_BIG_FIL_POST_REV_8_21_14_020_66_15]
MLHMSSILLSLTVVQLIMAAVLVAFGSVRSKANGLKEMALAAALGGIGTLVAGAGAGMLDFRLAGAGTVCFVFAMLAAARSMARLQGRRPSRALETAAGVLGGGAVAYFALVQHNVAGILVSVSIVYAVVSALVARDLFGETDPALRSGCRILGVLFAVFAVLHVIRIFVRPLMVGTPGPGGQIVLIDVLFAFVGLAIVIGWCLGLLWAIYSSAEYRLRAAYDELDRFTSAVAHDLKSPLNAVIGNIEAITHLGPGLDAAQRGRFLASAHEAAIGMNSFIGELLADARTDRGQTEAEAVDPGDCLRAARDNLRAQIEAVAAEIDADPLPAVRANRLQVTRVFQNLLDNAVKYRSLERPLTIRVTGERQGGMVRIAVRDNGVGIAQADQGRVFDLFERAGKQALVQGDGIGLAECKRIVEKFGGAITLASELGAGSTFTVSLPAADA